MPVVPAGRLAGAAALLVGTLAVVAHATPPDGRDPVTIHVFHGDVVHFTPDEPGRWDTPTVSATENGRVIERTVTFPEPEGRVRAIARVGTRPIAQDAATPFDKWDRAGNVRLVVPGGLDLEIVRFMTAYGGSTSHEVDVTHLLPLLAGERTVRGFVDTWISPGWRLDFELVLFPVDPAERADWMDEWMDPDPGAPGWAVPVLYEESVTAEQLAAGDLAADVTVPEGVTRVELRVITSGHCTDGRGADEFETKDHVISIDGAEVERFRPWRDDCRRFREVNPHCRRWFDGSWSSDFPRSGWCPGDAVESQVFDLTAALAPGPHRIGYRVEGIRPADGDGQYGYWRVSVAAVGWR
jgi:hypothetical protein